MCGKQLLSDKGWHEGRRCSRPAACSMQPERASRPSQSQMRAGYAPREGGDVVRAGAILVAQHHERHGARAVSLKGHLRAAKGWAGW